MATRPKLNIPKQAQNAFRILVQMEETELRDLGTAFREIPPFLKAEDFASAVSDRSSMNLDDAKDVVTSLMGLYLLKNKDQGDAKQVADDIVDALERTADFFGIPKVGSWEAFRGSLENLLAFDESLGITAKAYDVLSHHSHVYLEGSSRLITDVRPIFQGDSTTSPKAAVIVHSLSISYIEDGESRTFYVALDSGDVKELKLILEKAQQKEDSIKSTLESANVRYLGLE